MIDLFRFVINKVDLNTNAYEDVYNSIILYVGYEANSFSCILSHMFRFVEFMGALAVYINKNVTE